MARTDSAAATRAIKDDFIDILPSKNHVAGCWTLAQPSGSHGKQAVTSREV
jgi:hypothetical protein